jgi:hypothetical protein
MAVLTPLQVAAAAYAGGFRGEEIREAVAVSFAESSWNTDAANFCCNGLWQINLKAHQKSIQATVPNWNWRDPVHNALAAHMIWRGAGGTFKKDWSGYGNANYNKAMPQARMALAQLRAELSKNKGDEQGVIRNLLSGVTGQVGSTPGPGVADSIGNVATNLVPGVKEIGQFFNALTQGSTWLRIAEGALGVLLVGLGIAAITKGTPIGSAIRSTPVGKIAKVVK